LKLIIELEGNPTHIHCSGSSGFLACKKLNSGYGRCRFFGEVLNYDFDMHAYERCKDCLKSEVK
jgi:hypothetical protein